MLQAIHISLITYSIDFDCHVYFSNFVGYSLVHYPSQILLFVLICVFLNHYQNDAVKEKMASFCNHLLLMSRPLN